MAEDLYGRAPHVFVVSCGVQSLDVGDQLSPAVAASVPLVVDAVVGLVAGHAAEPTADELRVAAMHEVSLVAELVAECERRAAGRPVQFVRVRHASTVPAPALRQAFLMLTEGGNLAEASLEVETFEVELQCSCGFAGALGHDDLIGGSVAVCPACGDVSTIRRTAELELLEVRVAPGARGGVE